MRDSGSSGDETRGLRRFHVPWVVWAAIAAALIILVAQALADPRVRVPVVGSAIALRDLGEDDAPATARFELHVSSGDARESLAQVRNAVGGWPDAIVIAFPTPAADDEVADYREALDTAVRVCESSLAVPVVIGPDSSSLPADVDLHMHQWFRRELCTSGRWVLCIDPRDHPDESSLHAAVAAAVVDALGRKDAWRATTQTQ